MKSILRTVHPVMFIVLLFFIISCKKENKSDSAQTADLKPASITSHEQAFPGIHGEVLSFPYGKDSIHVEKKGDMYVWLGDVVYDQETLDKLLLEHKNLSQGGHDVKQSESTFTDDYTHLWPSGQVYYTIQAGFSAQEQTMIADAITHWRNNTPLVFTQRTNQTNYVSIVPGAAGSGLYSNYVGMKGGMQIINLQTGAFITGSVIHEIGHAIGLIHEQCRGDRSTAILVNYNNVSPHTSGNIYQFETYYEQGQSGTQIGTFDFGSIMLYGSYDFSDGIHPVMTKLDGTVFDGQRNALSAGDIQSANYLYHPVYAWATYVVTDQGGDIYSNYSSGNVYVNFYQDAARTIPATLAFPIDLQYATISTNDCSSYVISPNDMIIPAGTPGQILLGSFSNSNTYDSQEDPISCSSSTVGLNPGIGYRTN